MLISGLNLSTRTRTGMFGIDLALARATKEQYNRMIAEGLGDLDKSGIAELTFKDRHNSGDRV